MSDEENLGLSHVAFAVLGLVAEHPCHGKDINERVEERGMREWTAIGKSSIYGVLKNLKKIDLVDSWVEEVDNRIVKMYQITPKGETVLKSQIYRILNEFVGKNDQDFYMAFSMLPVLSQEEQIEAITNSLNAIRENKKELEQMLNINFKMPLNVKGLFVHPIKILETDTEFLEWVLKEIKEGRDKIDPKT
ncbi:MAG: Transcriptional regulator PadR-like family protein [Candidatus Lokiarchaeum sp. GC14_75]|nr:MAG: Transcriptional regulator PadR-like family protein [Candidatus Lokiarchaeum sp. GC14_75]